MSEMLLKALEDYQRIIHALTVENIRLKEVIETFTESKRRHYPSGFHCVRCGAPTSRPRRGWCGACYQRWYRRQRARVG